MDYFTSDKFITSGNDPAKYDPTSITSASTHNIVVSSILKRLKFYVDTIKKFIKKKKILTTFNTASVAGNNKK